MNRIKIDNPCTEDWDNMQECGANKFCLNCNKTVYDFTTLSTQDALKVLNAKQKEKTCGRFTKQQLKRINTQLDQKSQVFSRPIITVGFFAMSMLVSACNSSKVVNSNSKDLYKVVNTNISNINRNAIRIKGVVIDENQSLIPFAIVELKGRRLGVSTDIDGEFIIDIPTDSLQTKHTDTLKISFVGYKSTEIPLTEVLDKEIQVYIKEDDLILGGFCFEKIPLHKRIWFRVKYFFERKE